MSNESELSNESERFNESQLSNESELYNESELSDESSVSLAGIRVDLVKHRRVGGGPHYLPGLTLGIAEIRKHSSAVFRSHKRNMNIQAPCRDVSL